jgi:hypothetical protein
MADVLVSNLLKQKAVYWAPLGFEDGAMQYDEPIEIKCRWNEMAMLYINAQGEQAPSKCVVMVDRDLELGGVLWLGELGDLDDQAAPLENEGANIIQGWTKVANPSATKFVRQAIC